MKNPIISTKNRFSEVKGRTLLLVIVVIIVFIIAAVFSFRGNENTPLSSGGTQNARGQTVKAPGIESVPGTGDVNDQAYIALQQQANAQHAEEAIRSGESAVATVTNDQFVSELTIPEPGIASIEQQTQAAQSENMTQYQKAYEEQVQREKQREIQRQQEAQMQMTEANQEAYETLMQAQLKALMGQWKPPSQSYVHNAEAGSGTPEAAPVNPGLPPMYKAGDIIFGVMETSVNSDEPGPVMAKVISGPLTGSKLLGSFKRVDAEVFIEFTILNDPNLANSIPVTAVAIDPETARTALATNVDHHRLLRYSTLFASAFLQGMGDAVLAGIQPDFTVDGDVFSVNSFSVGTRDQVIVGLGEVGRKAGEKFDKYFDIPPTVTVDSGTAIGLMFLQDFSLQPGGSTVQVVETGSPPPASPSYAAVPAAEQMATATAANSTQSNNTVTKP